MFHAKAFGVKMAMSRKLLSIPGRSTHVDTCSVEARCRRLVIALCNVSLLGRGDVCG